MGIAQGGMVSTPGRVVLTYVSMNITTADLLATDFTITEGPNDWSLATRKRSDGRTIQVWIAPNGSVNSEASLLSADLLTLDDVPTEDALRPFKLNGGTTDGET